VLQLAHAFASKGARVAVLDINADIAAKAQADPLGGGAKPFVCDVSDPDSVNRRCR
jgi:NAD(P)-dependent dehydrogenase (short-subunit alcohol dehydrogenase family)